MMASQVNIRPAGLEDVDALVPIINAAYRSDNPNAWTTEHGLVKDLRIDHEGLRHVIDPQNESETLLVAYTQTGVVGCICLEKCNDNGELDVKGRQALVGLFSVDPSMQGKGVGKLLMSIWG
jgi:predicted N-acetyltransferase YhbS